MIQTKEMERYKISWKIHNKVDFDICLWKGLKIEQMNKTGVV